MAKFIVVVFGLCLLPSIMCLCDSDGPSWIVQKLRAKQASRAEQLAVELKKINKKLIDKQPGEMEAGENFILIAQFLNARNMLGGPAKIETKRKEALEKLMSLRGLAGVCELHSSEEIDLVRQAVGITKSVPRIERIVDLTMKQQFDSCAQTYRRDYERLFARLLRDRENYFDFVQAALDKLTMDDFSKVVHKSRDCKSSAGQIKQMIVMPDFAIGQDAAKAIEKIALQIAKQVKETSQWRPIKESGDADDELKAVFDNYLFEPCEHYNEKLGPVLGKASILSTFASNEQFQFFDDGSDRERFFRAIFDYGFCGKLLDERDQLYPSLYKAWREVKV